MNTFLEIICNNPAHHSAEPLESIYLEGIELMSILSNLEHDPYKPHFLKQCANVIKRIFFLMEPYCEKNPALKTSLIIEA